MHQPSRLILALIVTALASPSAAFAQSPAPTGSSSPAASPMPAMTLAPATTAPSATSAPSRAGSTRGFPGEKRNTNVPNLSGQIKQIKPGTLSRSETIYAITHPVQEANQLRKMGTVDFDNLRIYRLPSSLKATLKVSDADAQRIALAMLGSAVELAQTTPPLPTTNGSNSPIQYLRNVLANINVSNALNNLSVLNNSNVNVHVSLSNVLNNNKVSIGQVVGLYIGGGGIITTITK